MEHGDNDNTIHCDNDDNQHPSPAQQVGHDNLHGESLSPQPLITLTDMSDSTLTGRHREQILYSEDFDAIQDYLQSTDSPMLTLSPSWLCRGTESSVVHVFPPNSFSHSVSHSTSLSNGSAMHVSGTALQMAVTCASFSSQPAMTSALPSHSSTIDMSASIGSSSLHGREVCFCVFVHLIPVC